MTELPDEIELVIDGIAQGGAGVGRWQGLVIFAMGGLPGERVCVRLAERKKRFARGDVIGVLEPSPDRIAPLTSVSVSDHMPWHYIRYEAQLELKRTILIEQLGKLAGLTDPPVAAVLPAPQPWGYRNAAHLRITRAGQVGYYANGSHDVQDLSNDPLLLPVLNEALEGLRTALVAVQETTNGSSPHTVLLRGSATHHYAVARLQGRGNLSPIARYWRDLVPALAGVSTDNRPLTLHEELADILFSLSLDSFFQTNTEQAEQLLTVVQAMLNPQPDECLLDAYSGVGLFALPLARWVRQVIAIEENSRAVRDGEQSAQLNEIENIRFIAAQVETALTDLTETIDIAILDPPRRGCHPAVLKELTRLAPSRIAYVSCQPGILARDLRSLLEVGYELQSVQPIDMFPQTPHIESVALLTRSYTT